MKVKKVVLFAILIILTLTLKTNSYGTSIEDIEEKIKPEEYTERYEQWLNLDDEEKEKTIVPSKYAIESKYSNDRSAIQNMSRSSILFSKLMIVNRERYDLRDDITINVKNQQSTAQCWTFASNSVIETNIEKTTGVVSPLFSTRYLEYATSLTFRDGRNSKAYNREVGTGGFSEIAFNFYASGNGPVLESEFPFENNTNKIYLSNIQNLQVQKQLNEYIRFPGIYKTYSGNTVIYKNANGDVYTANDVAKIRNSIKEHIMQYGAVTSQTYGSGTVNSASKYYNNPNSIRNSTAYFCNNPNEMPDHQITIIGWDDNYAVSNFNSSIRPNSPGAYIVLNSWGENFGENGVYYISYEDCFIEETITGVTSVSDINYDQLYQYDNLGNNDVRVFTADIFAANIFTRNDVTKNEYISQIAISNLANSECDIYVNIFDSDLNLEKCTLVKKNYYLSSGYHTITLDEPLKLQGEKFAVIIKCLTDDEGFSYLPLEVPDNLYWKTATGGTDRAYISLDAIDWLDINEFNKLPRNSDLCFKAFTIYEDEDGQNNQNEEPQNNENENGQNNQNEEPQNNENENGQNNQNEEPQNNENENEQNNQNEEPQNNENENEQNNQNEVPQNNEENNYTIESTKYKVDEDIIYGISPNTTLEEFNKNITTSTSYSIYPIDIIGDQLICTGAILQIGDKSYTLVVKGDMDENGKITITDVVKARLHLSKIKILNGIQYKALDANGDGNVTITDIVMINLASMKLLNL